VFNGKLFLRNMKRIGCVVYWSAILAFAWAHRGRCFIMSQNSWFLRVDVTLGPAATAVGARTRITQEPVQISWPVWEATWWGMWVPCWQLDHMISVISVSSRYSDSLLAGRSGDRIPSGGEIFRTCPDRSLSPPSLLHNGYRVFPGGKAAGAWRWPPTPSSAEIKEKVDLYLCSPSRHSWPALWTLIFTFYVSKLVSEWVSECEFEWVSASEWVSESEWVRVS